MLDESASGEFPASWTDLPSSLLRAELLRRRDADSPDSPDLLRRQNATAPGEKAACGTGRPNSDYNMPLHVFALVLILVLSTLACSFPILVRRIPRLPVPRQFLFLSRHFGTGVLIATAFVHLLPTAFTSLTDPCLPRFWNQGYPAMAGFIAMISVMVVVGIEMFFATKGAGHSHSSEYVSAAAADSEDTVPLRSETPNGHTRPPHPREESFRRFKQAKIGSESDSADDVTLQDGSRWPRDEAFSDNDPLAHKHDHGLDDDDDDGDGIASNSDLDLDELDDLDPRAANGHDHAPHQGPPSNLSDHQQQQKMLLQCLLLEAGILFHSVFIGMAVSVATGTSFIVLLVAISFHQTFEGLALGSRIAAITIFPKRSPRPWLMALAYGTTTPVGQAIGLLVHNLYDPYSQTGLLMVGIMNAISSGLLLFAGLVELLAEDFLSEHSYETLGGKKRLQACAAVVAGSLLMALVGAWA